MSKKITVTTEEDGRIVVFEGSGTLELIERSEGWVDTRPLSMTSREVRGLGIEWDGTYMVREADRQNRTLEELREENDRLERILQAPLSVKDLEVAWENAEQASECRAGDTLIEFFGNVAYHVYPTTRDYSSLPPAIRILSRAPRREPWADLADVLRTAGHLSPTVHAKDLYERGVRVVGGDDDE